MQTFSILGDSISTFSKFIPNYFRTFYPVPGYDVTDVNMTWWKLLENNTSLKLSVNNSFSGSRVSETGNDAPKSVAFINDKRLDLLKGDIIIVFGGTNDFGQAEDQASFTTFENSYLYLIDKLKEKLPNSKLYFCTPLQRTDFALDEENSQGWTQFDMANTIKELVSKANVNLIDLFSYPIQKDDGLLQDGIHPTQKGMKIIYDITKKAILGAN